MKILNRMIGVLLLLGIIGGAVLYQHFTQAGQPDLVSEQTLIDKGLGYLRPELRDLQRKKVELEGIKIETEIQKEEAKQEEIALDQAYAPVWKKVALGSVIGLVVAMGMSWMTFAAFKGIGVLREKSMVTQKIGESLLQVHYSIAKQPEFAHYTAGLIQVEGLRAIAPERMIDVSLQMIDRWNVMARSFNSQAALTDGNHRQLALMPAQTHFEMPTFSDLLRRGKIAPGKPLLIGFLPDGQPKRSELSDNYSTVVIGQSGMGKTSGEAFSIASTILAYNARYTILDPHYPDKKKESLGDRLGTLKSLSNITIYNNPLNLDEVVRHLDLEFDAYKQSGQGHVPHIIVVDEHKLWISSSNGGKELLRFEERMIFEGRKYDWYLHVTSKSPLSQDFGSSAVRDNFITSYLYKTKKKQAQTFLQDSDVVELVQSCDKPGMAVYTDRKNTSHIVRIPEAKVEDMDMVVCMVGNAPGGCVPENKQTPHQTLPVPAGEEIIKNIGDTTGGTGTSVKPKGIIDLDSYKHQKEIKKIVVHGDAEEPTETDIIVALNQICEHRPEEMSKNQWVKALAEATGYSLSYTKNLLLGNVQLSQDARDKLTGMLEKLQEPA